MEKIKNFTIISVKMTGFKRFSENYEVQLDSLSYVTGDNGQGKTSIADAIAYAFCGVPFWGERSSDRLLNQGCIAMHVEVGFVDENGEVHNLIRLKNGNNTTITLDTIPMRQTDITSIFAEKDIFLSMFNPLYFIEKIADDGREFLQKLLPCLEQNTVLEKMSESTRALLENESLLDPDYYIKVKRERIRELSEDNTYFTGQIDLLKTQKYENSAKLNETKNRVSELKSLIKDMETKQFEGIDIEVLKEKRQEIIELMSSDLKSIHLQKKVELENKVYQSKFSDELNKLNVELNSLILQHGKLNKLCQGLKPGIKCPTCFREVTKENIASVASELATQLATVTEKGKALKDNLAQVQSLDKKSEEKFLEYKNDDLKKINEELKEFDCADLSEISLIDDTLRVGNLSEEQASELCSLRAELTALESDVSKFAVDNTEAEITKLEGTIKASNEETIKLKNLIHAASEYAVKRAELTLVSLKMDKAAIKLYDVAKTTGEIKNIFRFTYDGKDYRWLSTSEQIKAGLEVADLLRSLTGCNYPTYIDNAEAITTKLAKPQGQTIFAFAKKGDLSVKSCKINELKEAA